MVLYSTTSQNSLNLCPVAFSERPQSPQQALMKQGLGTNDVSKRAGYDGFIAWFFYMPQEFLSVKLFLCYSWKTFVQDVPLRSVSFSLGLQGTGYSSEQIFCLRNSVWLEEKCWISMNPSFALFPLNRELALFDLFLQNNVDKKTLIYLCIWDVSVSLQQQYQHIFKYTLSILCPKNNAITLCWLFCSNVVESDCKAILTQIICQFGFYYKN